MIDVDERFEVPAATDVVWRLLADPYAVVGCVPGAAITAQNDDGSLETTLTVKFGPLSVGFQARAELELDPATLHGKLTARGKDKQGGARFQASAAFSVERTELGSEVVVRGEVDISGRMASMIEAGAGIVVKKMAGEFAACLRERCSQVG